MLRVCDDEGRESGEAESLAEHKSMEVEALFCRENGVLKWELGERRVGEEEDVLVCIALDKGRRDRRDA